MAGFTPTLFQPKDHQHCSCSTQSKSQAVAFSVPPTCTWCSEPQMQSRHLFSPLSCYQIFICSHTQSREEGGCEEGVSDSFSFLSETAAGNANKRTPQHKSHLLPVSTHTRWGNSWVTTTCPSARGGSDAVNPADHTGRYQGWLHVSVACSNIHFPIRVEKYFLCWDRCSKGGARGVFQPPASSR